MRAGRAGAVSDACKSWSWPLGSATRELHPTLAPTSAPRRWDHRPLTVCVKHLQLPRCPHVRSVDQELLGQLVVVHQAVSQAHTVRAHGVAPAEVEVPCGQRGSDCVRLTSSRAKGCPGWACLVATRQDTSRKLRAAYPAPHHSNTPPLGAWWQAQHQVASDLQVNECWARSMDRRAPRCSTEKARTDLSEVDIAYWNATAGFKALRRDRPLGRFALLCDVRVLRCRAGFTSSLPSRWFQERHHLHSWHNVSVFCEIESLKRHYVSLIHACLRACSELLFCMHMSQALMMTSHRSWHI